MKSTSGIVSNADRGDGGIGVLSVVDNLWAGGGVSHMVVSLRFHSGFLLRTSRILTSRIRDQETVAIEADRGDSGSVFIWVPTIDIGALRRGWLFRKCLDAYVNEFSFDLLHNHGVWTAENHACSACARGKGIPMLTSSHGMLSRYALSHKFIKKKLGLLAYQRRDLESAAVLHATNEMEAGDLRTLGMRQPIAVIPNGLEIPPPLARASLGSVPRIALFLSRIHPVKGLLNLVAAWAKVRPQGWKLVIAGPDAGGHQAEVARAAGEAGISDFVEFVGPVFGDAKWELYSRASLFVLPTFSENFGIVVAEALACEVPVIITKGAPWKEVETHDCGWWIDIGIEPLVAALDAATRLSPDELRAMGIRGRALIEENYTWPRIARRMVALYSWIVGNGERPECVRMD